MNPWDFDFLMHMITAKCLACGQILSQEQEPLHCCPEGQIIMAQDPGIPLNDAGVHPSALHAYSRGRREGV